MPRKWTLLEIETHLVSEMHHGKPGLSAKKKVALAEELRGHAASWIPSLMASIVPGSRQLAALLMAPLWLQNPQYTEAVFRLAQDEDWEVREWAVVPFEERCLTDPQGSLPLYQYWAKDAPDGVKRAIAVAVKGVAHGRSVPPDALLDVVDALIVHPDSYLRKNLGPFCIGDALLPIFPEKTLARLQRWAHDPEWPARWNTAAAFTAKKAAVFQRPGEDILAGLLEDSEPLVRREAGRALKKLRSTG